MDVSHIFMYGYVTIIAKKGGNQILGNSIFIREGIHTYTHSVCLTAN